MKTTVTIELNNEDIQSLGGLLDIAVKAAGIEAAKRAVPLYRKLEEAVAKVNKENENGEQLPMGG